MNKVKMFDVVDKVCTALLGVVAVYFVGKAVYNRGFQDGCDATLTANQII